MKENLKLWDLVCETDPKFTKKANVRGNRITAIDPQYQIMKATEQFGPYGSTWGFKNIELDYSISNLGMVIFKAVFFYPNAEFPIINSSSLYIDNAKTKMDQDFAKKIETDTLTKALSKLGFNADIFLGKYDDSMYLKALNEKIEKEKKKPFPIDEFDNLVKWALAKNKSIEFICNSYDVDENTINKLKKALDETNL